MKMIAVVLALVAFVSSNVMAKSTMINPLTGTATVQVSQGEKEDDAKALALYQTKHDLAEKAAEKLISEHGVEASKDELVAVIMTTQEFTFGDAVKTAGGIGIPVYLAVNKNAIVNLIANNTVCWKKLTCKWSRDLFELFRKALACKNRGNFGGDYQRCVNRVKALQAHVNGLYQDNSVEYSTAAVEAEPDNAIVLSKHGGALADEGDFEGGEAAIDKALAIEPGLLESYIVLGNSYYKSGDYDKAVFQFKKALKMDPNYALAHYSLAMAYSKMDMKAKSDKHMKLAAENNMVINGKAVVHKVEKAKDVVEENEAALEVSKDEQGKAETAAEAVVANGNVVSASRTSDAPAITPYDEIDSAVKIRKGGNPRASISKLETLMNKYPKDTRIKYQLGWCYFELKEYNNAIKFYKQSLNHFASPKMIGSCYEELKDDQKAVNWLTSYERDSEWCQKAKEKNPWLVATSFAEASLIFYDHKNYDKGVKWGIKSTELHPTPFAYWVMGWNHYKLKNYKDAVVAFENALRLEPDNKTYKKDLKMAKKKTKLFGIF